MRIYTSIASTVLVLSVVLVPQVSRAAEKLEMSGWIPYWRSAQGVADIMPRLDQFTEVNPFIYTLMSDGGLNREGDYTDPEWAQLKAAAKAKHVRFIPSIMSGSGETVHAILSNETTRHAHVANIAREVYANNLDGIDIDYEGKLAETNPYYSLFLKELADAIGYDKWVMCTIEARTPLDSRFSSPESVPTDLAFANDFKAIGTYCDRVRIMTYDQGRGDLLLNKQYGHPYIPVADTAWVEKVMRLTASEIDPAKLAMGVATYGYEYDMYQEDGQTGYSNLWAFNPRYAAEVSAKIGIAPTRNAWGEMQLVYPASKSTEPIIPLPNATRVMSWSDGEAIKQKMVLAQSLGIKGIAIFKIDGGEDPTLWNHLPTYALLPTPATFAASHAVPSGTEADQPVEQDVVPQPGELGIVMPSKNLSHGMRHADVITLQKFLNSQGFVIAKTGGGSPGKETNYFGPATKAAMIKFQKSKSIAPATGTYGPLTRAAVAKITTPLRVTMAQ